MPGIHSFQVTVIAQATVLKRINVDSSNGGERLSLEPLSQPLLHTIGASALSAIPGFDAAIATACSESLLDVHKIMNPH